MSKYYFNGQHLRLERHAIDISFPYEDLNLPSTATLHLTHIFRPPMVRPYMFILSNITTEYHLSVYHSWIPDFVHSLTHWSSHCSAPLVLPDTNLAVRLACGHTVSLYVCPGNNSNCNALTHGDMVSLDEGRFPALELNNRRLSVKNSFCRKNGVYTRSAIRSDSS